MREFGVTDQQLSRLEVDDAELRSAYPEKAPREARAIRTRVLRDLLRVLPASERDGALGYLEGTQSNLIEAEAKLKEHLGTRLSKLTNEVVDVSKMGAMQRANFTTALSKLPEQLRSQAFSVPTTDGDSGSRVVANYAESDLLESGWILGEEHLATDSAACAGENPSWPQASVVGLWTDRRAC